MSLRDLLFFLLATMAGVGAFVSGASLGYAATDMGVGAASLFFLAIILCTIGTAAVFDAVRRWQERS